MTPKRGPEGEKLIAWLASEKRATKHARMLARRLAEHPGMRAAWRKLRKHGDVVLPVFDDVFAALAEANKEITRLPRKDEREQLARVKRIASELKRAIEHSPLPRNSAALVTLQRDYAAPFSLWVGWRDLKPNADKSPVPIVTFVELLDLLPGMVDIHAGILRPRAVARQRDMPLESAFVRWLAVCFRKRFGDAPPGTLAVFASAALDRQIDRKAVERILKTSPAAFRTELKRPARDP